MTHDLLLVWAGGIAALSLLAATEDVRRFRSRELLVAALATIGWPFSILLVLVMPGAGK